MGPTFQVDRTPPFNLLKLNTGEAFDLHHGHADMCSYVFIND